MKNMQRHLTKYIESDCDQIYNLHLCDTKVQNYSKDVIDHKRLLNHATLDCRCVIYLKQASTYDYCNITLTLNYLRKQFI